MNTLRIGYERPYSWTFACESETMKKSQAHVGISSRFLTT
jgi:hypothetical protein